MTQSFTSSQISQRTGLTARQLQWWDEQGVVVPAHRGHRRLYSAEDLAELIILSGLRRRGFSLQRIRRMMALLRREFGRRLSDLLSHGRELHLLTDGESVFLCDSERGVIDLLRNTQQPLLAICVGPVLEGVPVPHVEEEVNAAAKRSKIAKQAGSGSPEAPVKSMKQASPAPAKLASPAPKKSCQPARLAGEFRASRAAKEAASGARGQRRERRG
jgi:DNA-binding transcriptional MerR regulator